jgi:hypothetical protein
MELLATCSIPYKSEMRHLSLYRGDLAAIPPDEAVDLLIVSAFPNDYVPTTTSLIGALNRKGISVAKHAADKEVDLRSVCSCWLSKDLSRQHSRAGFRRLMCFEPPNRAGAPEVVGDVFRAIMPFALGEPRIRSIAMPILTSGDQRNPSALMLAALVNASLHWLSAGLPVDTIKIVVYAEGEAELLRRQFASLVTASSPIVHASEAAHAGREVYDFFVSYAHDDRAEVDVLVEALKGARPSTRVFQDKLELKLGEAWQEELDRALEFCRKVIAVYSPSYLKSKMCMEEFNMARLRHRESEKGVLLPIYLRSANLPLYVRSLQYMDCREGNVGRVKSMCRDFLESASR